MEDPTYRFLSPHDKLACFQNDCMDTFTTTTPAKRALTEQAITTLYKAKRLKQPQFIWFDNPVTTLLFAVFKKALSTHAGYFPETHLPARRFLRIQNDLQSAVQHTMTYLPDDDPLHDVKRPAWLDMSDTVLLMIQQTFWDQYRNNHHILDAYADQFYTYPHIRKLVGQRFHEHSNIHGPDIMSQVYRTLQIMLHNATFRTCLENTCRDMIFGSISKLLYDYQLLRVFQHARKPINLIQEWEMVADNCFCWMPYLDVCLLCEHPVVMSMSDASILDRQLHCADGPAMLFADGLGFYCFNGVVVNEQIICEPHTQTVDQILNESNEEVRRIRIEQFGWVPLLSRTSAQVLDHMRDAITQTHEFLMQLADIRVLVCACPSTARVYAMQVPLYCMTVSQAQDFLSSGLSQRLIGAS